MSKQHSPVSVVDEVRLISHAFLGVVKQVAANSIDGFNRLFTVDDRVRAHFYRERGVAHTKQGRHWQAMPLLEQVLRYWPDDEETLFHLGYSYLKTEQTREGILVLERANHSPATATPRVSSILGMAYIQAKEYQKAVEVLRAALEKSPTNFNLHYRLGLALDHLGEYDAAIEAFQNALTIRPNELKIYQSIGFVLDQQGKHEEAVVFFKKTREMKEVLQENWDGTSAS
ncbi:MAG: tetratricopeptide repeat protein [Magnetococcales bacterium]|nr:tetratricopeptide repeat protein [Magnetococcales bacterium]MBF0116023.1 tetratricopeptide repeat protein [Magnetococcales bacterium]